MYVRYRDKDIPAALTNERRIGFVGSDTFQELSAVEQDGLVYRTVAKTGLRLALLAQEGREQALKDKRKRGETLKVVTSYPRAAKRMSRVLGCGIKIVATPGGSVEAGPVVYEEADAVIDIVRSGDTAKDNKLVICRNKLQPVTLGAIWRERPARVLDTQFDASGVLGAISAVERRVTEAKAGAQDSYTQRLAGDENRLRKKLGEEFAEFLGEVCVGSAASAEAEAADMLYTMATAIAARGGSLVNTLALFASRNTA